MNHKYKSLLPGDDLANLDRINTIIVESVDLDAMLRRLLDELLDMFQCDRAWLMFPCDPQSDVINIRWERTRPEWPGIFHKDGIVPASEVTKLFLDLCQKITEPLRIDPENQPLAALGSADFERYHVKSQMSLPLKPNNGPNWVLGIQHCSEAVVYEQVAPQFHAIGKRIASGITSAMAMDDLRGSENRYRSLFNHASDAIVITDLETGKFIEANPMAARLFNVAVENLVCRLGPVELSPEFQPCGTRSSEKAIGFLQQAHNGEYPTFEWTHQTVDGEPVACEITLGHYPDPSGQLVQGTIKDISERKAAEKLQSELEQRLGQSQKLETVGHMTGGVAHDFNNLLSVILGNLELLQLENDCVGDGCDFIQNAIEATRKGANLTKNMLSFARRAQLSPKALNLNTIVEDITSWSRRTIPATIDLKLGLFDDLWTVVADPASTESSVLNLIINARDAMTGQGVLTIETSNLTIDVADFDHKTNDLQPGNYVMLAISDTGAGIPKEIIDRVFEPFYTTKATGQGSGLGLSMVHGFMKQSGGSIHVYSEENTGTSVKLFFPALVQKGTVKREKSEEVEVDEFPSARILVAEDQPEVMKVILYMLKAAGHDAIGASSGDCALEIYQAEGPFDLLLSDIVMPGNLQGPALSRALRDLEPDLPVVFMTGYAAEASVHGNGLRAEDIRLMKPVSRNKLLEAIRTAIHPTAK